MPCRFEMWTWKLGSFFFQHPLISQVESWNQHVSFEISACGKTSVHSVHGWPLHRGTSFWPNRQLRPVQPEDLKQLASAVNGIMGFWAKHENCLRNSCLLFWWMFLKTAKKLLVKYGERTIFHKSLSINKLPEWDSSNWINVGQNIPGTSGTLQDTPLDHPTVPRCFSVHYGNVHRSEWRTKNALAGCMTATYSWLVVT